MTRRRRGGVARAPAGRRPFRRRLDFRAQNGCFAKPILSTLQASAFSSLRRAGRSSAQRRRRVRAARPALRFGIGVREMLSCHPSDCAPGRWGRSRSKAGWALGAAGHAVRLQTSLERGHKWGPALARVWKLPASTTSTKPLRLTLGDCSTKRFQRNLLRKLICHTRAAS